MKITKQTRIGVLYGGISSEREVSLRSGRAVLQALEERGYRPIGIDAGRDLAQVLVRKRVEVAFLALHGGAGEDGSVQGLLEVMGIPYTGSGVGASALGMDKYLSRLAFRAAGLCVPRFLRTARGGARVSAEAVRRELGGFPVMVKPRSEGSSVGVGTASNPRELSKMVGAALAFGGEALIEEFLRGREVHVGILAGEVMGEVEVVPRQGFYDYRAKYTPGCTDYLIPARIGPAARKDLYRAARSAYLATGAAGVARVDFIISRGRPCLLEINTIPGLTETSLIPKIAAARGVDYPRLVERILMTAGKEKAENGNRGGKPARPRKRGRS